MIGLKTELNGWVARNGTKKLLFFKTEPYRTRESLLSDEELENERTENGFRKLRVHYPRQWYGDSISFKSLPFDDEIFKDLKWEDEPVKVKLTLEIIK